jgi:hypothetical protein
VGEERKRNQKCSQNKKLAAYGMLSYLFIMYFMKSKQARSSSLLAPSDFFARMDFGSSDDFNSEMVTFDICVDMAQSQLGFWQCEFGF